MNKKLIDKQNEFKSLLSEKLLQLPMLPNIVARLLKLDHSKEDYQDKLIELVEDDPTFAARIIQLANSAYSHPVSPIITLREAVIRVGAEKSSNLVTSLGVIKVFTPTTQGEKNLWIHSLQTAVTAETITELSNDNVISSSEAYLCGLMHDIGRFIMFSESPEKLACIEDHNWESLEELVKLEQDICGFDHAELGWHACRKWHIPDLVSNIVKHHHHYKFADATTPELVMIGKIIRIIQLADRFSVLMMNTPELNTLTQTEIRQLINEQCLVSDWPELPIDVQDLAEATQKIVEHSDHLVEKLGLEAVN